MEWLLSASGVEEMLYKLTILVVATLAVVVLVLFSIIWAKFADLPFGSKVALLLAATLVTVMGLWFVAPSVLEERGVAAEALRALLIHFWRELDGFARTHPWVGVLLLMSFPILLWPSWDDEEV